MSASPRTRPVAGRPAMHCLSCRVGHRLCIACPAASFRVAYSHVQLAEDLIWKGTLAEAEAELRTGLTLHQTLADQYPAVGRFRFAVAFARSTLSDLLCMRGKPAEAAVESRLALAIAQTLVDDNPGDLDYSHRLAVIHDERGVQFLQLGKLADAEAELTAALALYQKLVDKSPRASLYRGYVACGRRAVLATWPARSANPLRQSALRPGDRHQGSTAPAGSNAWLASIHAGTPLAATRTGASQSG